MICFQGVDRSFAAGCASPHVMLGVSYTLYENRFHQIFQTSFGVKIWIRRKYQFIFRINLFKLSHLHPGWGRGCQWSASKGTHPSLQVVLRPMSCSLARIAVRLQVFLGHPCFLPLGDARSKGSLGVRSWSILKDRMCLLAVWNLSDKVQNKDGVYFPVFLGLKAWSCLISRMP